MICTLDGYGPCHNEEEIIAAAGYDPDADLANPSGSVFCTHGAGFVVNWDEVKDYMHLESCLGASNGKRRMEAIEAGAKSRGISMSAYALRWTLEQPAVVSAIVGVKSEKQLDDAVAAVG